MRWSVAKERDRPCALQIWRENEPFGAIPEHDIIRASILVSACSAALMRLARF